MQADEKKTRPPSDATGADAVPVVARATERAAEDEATRDNIRGGGNATLVQVRRRRTFFRFSEFSARPAQGYRDFFVSGDDRDQIAIF